MTEAITILGVDLATTSATDEARRERDEILARSTRGNIITTAEGAQKVATLLSELTNFESKVEGARQAAKEKPLELCRQIDALGHELNDQITAEKKRLGKVLGTWTAEQERLAAIERRRKYDEEQRIIREANEEAERKRNAAAEAQAAIDKKAADEAAAAAKKLADELAELELRASRTRSDNGAAKVAAEKLAAEKRAADEAAAARKKTEDAKAAADLTAKNEAEAHQNKVENQIATNRVAASSIAVAKPAGVGNRGKIIFEVKDIQALYENLPALVTLTPNEPAIRNALKQLREGEALPGVEHWREHTATVRKT